MVTLNTFIELEAFKEYYWSVICLSDAPDDLAQLGKVYCDLGYLTQSLQAHEQALNNITKECKPDEPKHQVSQTDSLICNRRGASSFWKVCLHKSADHLLNIRSQNMNFLQNFILSETMHGDRSQNKSLYSAGRRYDVVTTVFLSWVLLVLSYWS